MFPLPPPPYYPNDRNDLESRPSYDYSAYEQTGLGMASVEMGPTEPSTSMGSPYISTLLSSPDLVSWQPDCIGLIDPAGCTSAAFYFGGRPFPMRRTIDLSTYKLVIPPNARADQLSFPQPEIVWLSRDVTRLDWSTFANYLLPPDHDVHLDEKKALSNQVVNSASDPDRSMRTPSARKPVANSARSDSSKVVHDEDAKNMPRKETEAERLRRIQFVVAEWNLNFFEPRGVKVEEEIIPYSSALIPQTELTPLDGLHTESSSPSHGDDTPGSSSSEAQHAQRSNAWSWKLRSSHATRKDDAYGTANGRALTPTDIDSPSIQSSRATSESHTSDILSRSSSSSSSNEAQPHTPSTPHLQQPSLISRLSSTTTTSESLPYSNLDDLDDVDLKELRSAFAKFLLSSRSQEETAVALQELNQELQVQRQLTVKALKADMKTRRKEMKTLTRQHKEEQRTEKNRLKAAKDTRKMERKTMKQEKKELEKRQKQARKEVKMFKKNAKKAVKGNKSGAAPYKGWLEALELNRQESVTASTLQRQQ